MDDILVSLLFFQSLSPIVYLAIALLNQKKKIDYFFQIYAIQSYISHKNPNLDAIYLFIVYFQPAQNEQTLAKNFPAPLLHLNYYCFISSIKIRAFNNAMMIMGTLFNIFFLKP